MAPHAAHGRGLRAGATVLAWILVPAALLLVVWFVSPDYNPSGQCEGLGFGCTLSPRDLIELAVVFCWPIALGVIFFGLCVVTAVEQHRWMPDSGPFMIGTIGTVLGALTTFALVAILLVALGAQRY